MIRFMAALAALLLAVALAPNAEAKHRKHQRVDSQMSLDCVSDNSGRKVCQGSIQRTTGLPTRSRYAYDGEIIPNPPCGLRRAFCGAGAAYRVFGECRRDLFRASAWFRFPRSTPASGMVGVRSHHVFVLESHVGGRDWLVSDYNSGNHQSRRHVRSIAGYTIVDPHGLRMAAR